MTLLAGIDLSSRALHCALVPADDTDTSLPPVTFRMVELPRFKAGSTTAQYRSVERCRGVREAVYELLGDSGNPFDHQDVTSVWIEEPMGARNKATNVLRELYGAVLASIPSHIERAAISPLEWHRIVLDEVYDGLPLVGGWTKDDSVAYAYVYINQHTTRDIHDDPYAGFTEHHAEALLIAIAGRTLTHQAVEARR